MKRTLTDCSSLWGRLLLAAALGVVLLQVPGDARAAVGSTTGRNGNPEPLCAALASSGGDGAARDSALRAMVDLGEPSLSCIFPALLEAELKDAAAAALFLFPQRMVVDNLAQVLFDYEKPEPFRTALAEEMRRLISTRPLRDLLMQYYAFLPPQAPGGGRRDYWPLYRLDELESKEYASREKDDVLTGLCQSEGCGFARQEEKVYLSTGALTGILKYIKERPDSPLRGDLTGFLEALGPGSFTTSEGSDPGKVRSIEFFQSLMASDQPAVRAFAVTFGGRKSSAKTSSGKRRFLLGAMRDSEEVVATRAIAAMNSNKVCRWLEPGDLSVVQEIAANGALGPEARQVAGACLEFSGKVVQAGKTATTLAPGNPCPGKSLEELIDVATTVEEKETRSLEEQMSELAGGITSPYSRYKSKEAAQIAGIRRKMEEGYIRYSRDRDGNYTNSERREYGHMEKMRMQRKIEKLQRETDRDAEEVKNLAAANFGNRNSNMSRPRKEAILCLGSRGGEEALDTLISMMYEDDSGVTSAVDKALARRPYYEVEEQVLELLEDRDCLLVKRGLAMLGQINLGGNAFRGGSREELRDVLTDLSETRSCGSAPGEAARLLAKVP